MTDRSEPLICAVCARGAAGFGYLPRGATKRAPLFVCDDPECLPIARDTFHMKQDQFDRLEEMAALDGGRAVETYCEAIGKTDFREFSQTEFEEMSKEFTKAYRISLKGYVASEAPF